jgi:hypothetical protein
MGGYLYSKFSITLLNTGTEYQILATDYQLLATPASPTITWAGTTGWSTSCWRTGPTGRTATRTVAVTIIVTITMWRTSPRRRTCSFGRTCSFRRTTGPIRADHQPSQVGHLAPPGPLPAWPCNSWRISPQPIPSSRMAKMSSTSMSVSLAQSCKPESISPKPKPRQNQSIISS